MRDQVQHVIPAIALAAGCAMLFGMREQQRVQPRAQMAALQLDNGGYPSKDIVIDSAERRIAGMDDYVYRVFQRDSLDLGHSVYVGYYTFQEQGKAIHSPKNCLPGAGWESLQGGPYRVATEDGGGVMVNRFLMANKGAQAIVYYWYQGRGRVESDEYVVKWNLLKDAAVYGRTEEALVRIVVPIDMRQVQAKTATVEQLHRSADSLATRLASQLVPRVTKLLPASPAA